MFDHPCRPLLRTNTVLAVAACMTVALTGCESSGHGSAPAATPPARPVTHCSGTAGAGLGGTVLPFGTDAPTGASSALQIGAGRPELSGVPSGQKGFRLIKVPVRADVRTNGTFAVDHGQFQLLDRSGRSCRQPAINPLPDGFVALTVDESHPASGTVAFLVPASMPTTSLSVSYLPAPGAASASLRWRVGAPAPVPAKPANAGDGGRSTYRTQGVSVAGFGTGVTVGDQVVSTETRASTPKRRTFRPGPTQPNDVDAIDVQLRVTAHGADAYVDRRSFVLVDGTGRMCRSSALSSQGETLTSALVKKGKTADYTIVFWAPKGSTVRGLTLLELTKPGGTKVQAVWSDPKLTLKPLHD